MAREKPLSKRPSTAADSFVDFAASLFFAPFQGQPKEDVETSEETVFPSAETNQTEQTCKGEESDNQEQRVAQKNQQRRQGRRRRRHRHQPKRTRLAGGNRRKHWCCIGYGSFRSMKSDSQRNDQRCIYY